MYFTNKLNQENNEDKVHHIKENTISQSNTRAGTDNITDSDDNYEKLKEMIGNQDIEKCFMNKETQIKKVNNDNLMDYDTLSVKLNVSSGSINNENFLREELSSNFYFKMHNKSKNNSELQSSLENIEKKPKKNEAENQKKSVLRFHIKFVIKKFIDPLFERLNLTRYWKTIKNSFTNFLVERHKGPNLLFMLESLVYSLVDIHLGLYIHRRRRTNKDYIKNGQFIKKGSIIFRKCEEITAAGKILSKKEKILKHLKKENSELLLTFDQFILKNNLDEHFKNTNKKHNPNLPINLMEYAQYKKKYAAKDGQLIKVEANTNTFLEEGEYERSRLYYVLSRRKVKKEKAMKLRNTIKLDEKVERRRKKFSRKFDINYPTLSELIRKEKNNKLNSNLKNEIKTRKCKKAKISNNSSNSSNHSKEQKELIISQSQTQKIYSNIYNQEQSPYPFQSSTQSPESPDFFFKNNDDFLDYSINNDLNSLYQFKNDILFNADSMLYHNIMEDNNQTDYLSFSNEDYLSTKNSSITSHCLNWMT